MYVFVRQPVAFSELVVLQDKLLMRWQQQQQPRPDLGLRSRPSRCLCLAEERGVVGYREALVFGGQCSSAVLPPPPTSPALPSPRVAGGMVSSTGSEAPILSHWFFCLIKDKIKEGERLAKLGCCSALPLDAVCNCYFRGGGTGREYLFAGFQKGPLLSVSMRKSRL